MEKARPAEESAGAAGVTVTVGRITQSIDKGVLPDVRATQ